MMKDQIFINDYKIMKSAEFITKYSISQSSYYKLKNIINNNESNNNRTNAGVNLDQTKTQSEETQSEGGTEQQSNINSSDDNDSDNNSTNSNSNTGEARGLQMNNEEQTFAISESETESNRSYHSIQNNNSLEQIISNEQKQITLSEAPREQKHIIMQALEKEQPKELNKTERHIIIQPAQIQEKEKQQQCNIDKETQFIPQEESEFNLKKAYIFSIRKIILHFGKRDAIKGLIGNQKNFIKSINNFNVEQLQNIEMSKSNSIFNDVFVTTLQYGQMLGELCGLKIGGTIEQLMEQQSFEDDLQLLSCEVHLQTFMSPQQRVLLRVLKAYYVKHNQNQKQLQEKMNSEIKLDIKNKYNDI